MKKIALIPVDARPVTYDLPINLAKLAKWEVLAPEKEDLGYLKTPANFDRLFSWMEKMAKEVEGFVISMDMLLYGGLVPSRINTDSDQVIAERLQRLLSLKESYPALSLMVFSSTMRLSNSYVNEEEKDYWSEYGKEIWKYSYYTHKYLKYGLSTDQKIVEEMKQIIPEDILLDYEETRKRHFTFNQSFVQYVENGVFDLLVFPQDDTSAYGLNIQEQEYLHKMVRNRQLFDDVLIYPGADEVASVLMARMIYSLEGEEIPRFYPVYSGVKGSLSYARYEDRPLQESVKGQIHALGGHTVEGLEDAHILLGVNVPGEAQGDHALQEDLNRVNTQDRNVSEWIRKLRYYHTKGFPIAIADVAYANGADQVMVPELLSDFQPNQLAAYAAWNTAGNTIGTVVAHASLYYLAKKKGEFLEEHHEIEIMLRFLDDYLYQSIVRQEVRQVIDEQKEGKKLLALVQNTFREKGQHFIKETGSSVEIANIYLPWNRTFEIGMILK